MSDEGSFNVMAAAALVLGGLAALALAIVVASKEPSRPRRPSSVSPSGAGAATLPEEVEYQLEADETADKP